MLIFFCYLLQISMFRMPYPSQKTIPVTSDNGPVCVHASEQGLPHINVRCEMRVPRKGQNRFCTGTNELSDRYNNNNNNYHYRGSTRPVGPLLGIKHRGGCSAPTIQFSRIRYKTHGRRLKRITRQSATAASTAQALHLRSSRKFHPSRPPT